jgi:hypothetical protein
MKLNEKIGVNIEAIELADLARHAGYKTVPVKDPDALIDIIGDAVDYNKVLHKFQSVLLIKNADVYIVELENCVVMISNGSLVDAETFEPTDILYKASVTRVKYNKYRDSIFRKISLGENKTFLTYQQFLNENKS